MLFTTIERPVLSLEQVVELLKGNCGKDTITRNKIAYCVQTDRVKPIIIGNKKPYKLFTAEMVEYLKRYMEGKQR